MDNQIERDLLVVKVGTNTLTKDRNGSEALDWASFGRLGKQVVDLANEGYGVVLVSSGAIAAGFAETGAKRSEDMEMVEKQRLAGIGWHYVVEAWRSCLVDKTVGDMLLTRQELHAGQDTRREALATLDCHISHGDIVLVNENDAIAHEEIQFGCNDILSSILAVQLAKSAMYKSVRLVLLTDKVGLCQDKDDDETVIRVVDDIGSVEAHVSDTENGVSRGGMASKLIAAKIATLFGVETFIADGRAHQAIKRALRGEIGTRFRINGQEEDSRDNVEGLALEAVEHLLGAGLESIETEFKITQINKLFGLKSDEVHQLMRQKVIVARRGSSVFVSAVDAVMVYVAKKDEAAIESVKDRKRVRQQIVTLLEDYFQEKQV